MLFSLLDKNAQSFRKPISHSYSPQILFRWHKQGKEKLGFSSASWSLRRCCLLPWFLLGDWSGLTHELDFMPCQEMLTQPVFHLPRALYPYSDDVFLTGLPSSALVVFSIALNTHSVHCPCNNLPCDTSQKMTWLSLRIFYIMIREKKNFALLRLLPKIVWSHEVISCQRPSRDRRHRATSCLSYTHFSLQVPLVS